MRKSGTGPKPAAALSNAELAVELAHEALGVARPRLNDLAAEFLGRIGPAAAERLLDAATSARHPAQRLRAVLAIERVGDGGDVLVRLGLAALALHDPSPRVRAAADRVVWRLREDELRPAPGRASANADVDDCPVPREPGAGGGAVIPARKTLADGPQQDRSPTSPPCARPWPAATRR